MCNIILAISIVLSIKEYVGALKSKNMTMGLRKVDAVYLSASTYFTENYGLRINGGMPILLTSSLLDADFTDLPYTNSGP